MYALQEILATGLNLPKKISYLSEISCPDSPDMCTSDTSAASIFQELVVGAGVEAHAPPATIFTALLPNGWSGVEVFKGVTRCYF